MERGAGVLNRAVEPSVTWAVEQMEGRIRAAMTYLSVWIFSHQGLFT